jgi:CheY-like chemotaxis protein
VLDLNRIEAGKVPLQEHPFEVREWLQKIAQQASARADEKGLALDVSLEPRIPQHLIGDHVKIRQVLTNLLGNAVKFTQSGRVALRVELLSLFADTARLRFVVTDTGVGIAAERIPQLFEDFTQGGYEIGANYGGTGLGLAICKRLLALYGTHIEVSSEPGRRTEFRFDLALRVSGAPDAKSGEAAARLRGLSVLIVDDNHVDSLAISALLASWGLRLNAAADLAQAVDLVRRHHYDAILMERTIPGLAGESAARVLRRSAHPLGGSTCITALASPNDRPLDAGELIAAGFDDVVRKPVASESLLQALGRCCHQPS